MSHGAFPWRRLRGLLAARQITQRRFAAACALSEPFVCRLLTGSARPGRLSLILMERGPGQLGLSLDEELSDAG
jgi:hypothetical protein